MGRLLRCALILAWLVSAAGAQESKPPAKKPPAKPAQKAPAKKAPAKKKPAAKPKVAAPEYQFLSDELVLRKDGKLMWFYRTNHVVATNLAESLKSLKLASLETLTRKRTRRTFVHDMKEDRVKLSAPPTEKSIVDENVLILVFPPAYKDIIEEFIDRFDVPEPQVFIKARVVEVTLDSSLDLGTSMTFNRGTENANAFFRGFTSSFKPASFTEPNSSGISLFFDDLGEKYGTLTAEINALQERGSANILSEPSIVAAQGQLATLSTGDETPIFDITVTGGSERISTTFKNTGIRLDFMPVHIGREYCKLRVRVEVSSVTDFLTTQGTNVTVNSPVIAQRHSETVVTLRDEMTLVIGGLYAVSEIDDRAGIPILMDIPGLKYLFSRTKKTKVKSELDFFITPFIVKHRLDAAEFVPPGEKKRLSRLEAKKAGRKIESDEDRSAHETDAEMDPSD
ncbi:MAG: type II secretion system protein GspD [Planctomycetota bacterium]